MQYMGGKARIAKQLAAVIHAGDGGATWYLEPFIGGAFAFAAIAPKYPIRLASDAMPDLALLWQAVGAGWVPPTEITRERYAELRHAEPSPERAFAGFGCSFGGKWFGGYASNTRGDDFAGAAARGIERKRPALTGAVVAAADYRDWSPGEGWVVYCDPPYAGTTTYAGAPTWDATAFWAWATAAAERGARVFVSEYQAPPEWRSVWSAEQKGSLKATENDRKVIEHLFTYGTGGRKQ